MPDFAAVPKDVLVKILYDLRIRDILSFERTCTHARDTVLTRLLWLKKMDELGQHCAPDLPPNVDIDSLTAHDLRRIVVNALRTYRSVTKFQSPVAEYESMRIIFPSPPQNISPGQVYRFCDVKMAPGGRYLFMRCIVGDYDQLRLLDLEKEDRCIWSVDFERLHENIATCYDHLHYDFEVRDDGSVVLALIVHSFSENNNRNEISGLAKVLKLAPTGVGNDMIAMQEQDTISLEIHDQGARKPFCVIKGSFSVFSVSSSKITIVEWQKNQVATVDCSSLEQGPRKPQIWNDHFFYLDKGMIYPTRLCTLSLVHAMNVATQSPDTVKLQDLNVTVFGPSFGSGRYNKKPYDLRYSFFEHRKQSNSDGVMVIMIGTTARTNPSLVAIRATFKPASREKWTQVDDSGETKQADHGDLPHFTIGLGSTMTRSGRLLVSMQKNGRVGYALASIDEWGKLTFSELSPNVCFHIANHYGRNELEGMSNILEDFMDPYSGALILLKDRMTGKDAIELFYPK
ncbi:hypothetical protein A7U60_g6260 [Sanghuangporus baumii]|uniref:F-box domain-containing protein n=1 Tax=Sanghuangporus baumii TaxID=108892 RepID=A0A9Q5N7D8_SANBA|nr:hypothetical protein A7U60_g6260 [Sanghuangporus baumii]